MTPPPPRKLIPWYLRLGALVLAGCIATYVIVLYVYGIKLVDLASKISELSQRAVIAHDPPPPPREPGVV
ncbi:MAG: hypothetical protein JWO51_3555, partial [Rhodospirillales bacterium]|nr:hypothetical protein [Rhodospirillales bacterium]